MTEKKLLLYHDLRILLIITLILILIGCLFVYSSSSVYALEIFDNPLFFVKRQLVGLTLGFGALCIGRKIPIQLLKTTSVMTHISCLLLVSVTLFTSMSRTIHGSSRWLMIYGFSFQPSEILKVSLLFYVSWFLNKKISQKKLSLNHYFLLFFLIVSMSIILLKQPDFGMTIILLLTTILLFFIAHAQIRNIIITLICIIIGGLFLIIMQPYRLQRIITFLNPWQDPQGKGFQIIQSLIAAGSGSWCGTGIGHSRQKFFYLPMQHTDFIFSIIAEETGFFGTLFVITLFMLFLYFGIRIAHQLTDNFSALVTIGFTLLISLQAIINMAVVTGLAPTKGVGLPFISYGNTSLVCYLFMIGVIINMVRNNTISLK